MPALALCALLLASLPAHADAPAGLVNVRDFGAKGDGVTDDTEALRAAMKAASITVSQPSPVGTYYQAGPTLLFPQGVYLITDEIPIAALSIRGEGQAAIQQKDPTKDILTSTYAWQLAISNLTFVGGKSAINLYNPNIDTGQIVLDHCRFYGTADFALKTDVCSTSVRIQDCEFILCKQSWYNSRCDQAVVSDCWITSGQDCRDQAVIVHKAGRLTIENLVGVPIVGGPKLRWIDVHSGQLTCKQVRFGGEGGGFTPVYNFAKYTAGVRILLDDCYVSANASFNANCAVYCLEVPALIRLRDCELMGAAGIMVDRKLDLATYFTNVSPAVLSYTVEGCTGEFLGQVPAGLRKPRIRTVPGEKRLLNQKETTQALDTAAKDWLPKAGASLTDGVAKGHTQRTGPGEFIEPAWSLDGFMDATSQPLASWLALRKVGDDMLILYRQSAKGGWPHVALRATVDLDKFPRLTWHQKQTAAPGSFAVKVIDLDSGELQSLYAESFGGCYDYHAEDLKALFGGGVHNLEVRWYPLGWGMNSPTEKDYFWSEPGQYAVMDFVRFERE